jgi:Flp pilus assembly protein TadG
MTIFRAAVADSAREHAPDIRRKSQRGQSLVELALIGPILVLLSVAVADVGRAFYYREAVTNAARQAIRVAAQPDKEATATTAATANAAATSACSGTSGTVAVSQTTNIPDPGISTADINLATIANAAAIEAGSDGTPDGSVLKNATTPTLITVTFHCNGVLAETNATATSTDPTVCTAGLCSDSVTVQITYSMTPITPFTTNLLGGSAITLTTTETGRVEY